MRQGNHRTDGISGRVTVKVESIEVFRGDFGVSEQFGLLRQTGGIGLPKSRSGCYWTLHRMAVAQAFNDPCRLQVDEHCLVIRRVGLRQYPGHMQFERIHARQVEQIVRCGWQAVPRF